MLKLLARSATGQAMTIYTSIFGGVRGEGEKDGPEEFHLVLMDNGRSEILASEYRETLRCIRCGACLNACSIYRKIGGHAYGYVYSGPIGALITPLFQGLENYKDLPQASSLCGACYEACPVKINIPLHLINMRRDIVNSQLNGFWERKVNHRANAGFHGCVKRRQRPGEKRHAVGVRDQKLEVRVGRRLAVAREVLRAGGDAAALNALDERRRMPGDEQGVGA